MQLDLLQDEMELPVIPKPAKPAPAPKKSAAPVQTTIPLDLPEEKAPGAFKNISEAAHLLEVPQHVLRFWESRFTQIKPLKMRGGRRYYRPEDMEILTTIKNLLYKQGYTIEGAKKAFALLRGKKPVVAKSKAAADIPQKRILTDKKRSQIAVIRQELIGLRETLQAYM